MTDVDVMNNAVTPTVADDYATMVQKWFELDRKNEDVGTWSSGDLEAIDRTFGWPFVPSPRPNEHKGPSKDLDHLMTPADLVFSAMDMPVSSWGDHA